MVCVIVGVILGFWGSEYAAVGSVVFVSVWESLGFFWGVSVVQVALWCVCVRDLGGLG